MGMPWLQTKEYRCIRCGEVLLHDSMHRHVSYLCPERVSKQLLLLSGKTYEPRIGR